MTLEQGYPTEATVRTILAAWGIEWTPEYEADFYASELQALYGIIKAFEWAMGLSVYAPASTTISVRGGKYNWEGTVKTYTETDPIDPTDNDTTYVWMDSANTIQTAVDGTGWPSTPHIKLAEVVVDSDGVVGTITDLRGQTFLRRPNSTGFVPVPLTSLREVNSNDIPALSDTPLTSDPAGAGGILAPNTTPILEFANGDTDSCLRLNWAASNQDAVVFQVPLPPDLDTSGNVEIHLRAASASTTDAAGFDADSYFNEGDTKVEDSAAQASASATYEELTITIAATDVPSGAQTLTVELTPQAHTTDAMYLTAVWVEYTRV